MNAASPVTKRNGACLFHTGNCNKMSELKLWLDQYDDIYSDFDSRQFLKRRISEDFLSELRMAKKYRKERSDDLILFLPPDKRDENSENVIANSLKNFFAGQFYEANSKYRNKRNQAIGLLGAGVLAMTLNTFMNFKMQNSFLLSLTRTLMEPAGWFLLWLAFDFLSYDLQDLRKEKRFFEEFTATGIHFRSS